MSNGAGKFSPFPKSVLSNFVIHNKVLPKTVSFVTVHWCQRWGAQSAWYPCAYPPLGSAAYVTLSVQHHRSLRTHELKFHVATKHEQPLLGFHACRALELPSVVEKTLCEVQAAPANVLPPTACITETNIVAEYPDLFEGL